MATKPTEVTDWANSGSALKTATDSSRWNLGWQTLPGNQPTEVGERPNLNQQNYWQNAVHTWLAYFETATDDIEANIDDIEAQLFPETVSVLDIWEWDLDSVDAIHPNSGFLNLDNSSAQSGLSDYWGTGNQAECDYVGYYWEMVENLTRGVGIRIVDNADVVWEWVPVEGLNEVSDSEVGITGKSGDNGFDAIITLTIRPRPTVEIYKDGVLTADFATFSALADRPTIDAKNPNGFRAIIRAIPVTPLSYLGHSLSPLVRRRYRIMNCISSIDGWNRSEEDVITFGLRLTSGVTYKLDYTWNLRAGTSPGDITGAFYNNKTSTADAHIIDPVAQTIYALEGTGVSYLWQSSLSRSTIYTARDTGAGLDGIAFKLSSNSDNIWIHAPTLANNLYPDLLFLETLPKGVLSYITLEGN
jgi:hypothetical protein